MGVIEHARELCNSACVELVDQEEDKVVCVEFVVATLDHMRKVVNYLKILEKWTEELEVAVLIVMSKSHDLVVLMEGETENVTRYLSLWKTSNIDVDSKGRSCKERMLQIVSRNTIENETLGEFTENGSRFRFVQTEKLSDLFKNSKIETIMQNLFP